MGRVRGARGPLGCDRDRGRRQGVLRRQRPQGAGGHREAATVSEFRLWWPYDRFDLDKPTIAAVNGIAMGGGFEIALACDIIIASENAVFALPEPRVGLIAGAGGVHRLPRMIAQKEALGIILTGRRVAASEGRTLGFVNEVVAPGEAMSAARRWAELIQECSPKAVRASKQSFQRGLNELTLERAMRTTYPAQQENIDGLDYREGPRAFAEKRKPVWTNR